MNDLPLISIVVPTYNRGKTICRAIDSIFSQTYQNFEIVLVDDGSTDNTSSILKKYSDKRLKVIKHEKNRGVTAAKNTGLNNLQGAWFTILDSDDEISSNALESMIKIPIQKGSSISAVNCNCREAVTNRLMGQGLNSNQYVDFKTLITSCSGEFWGINKTTLLSNNRFNEKIPGLEVTLWYKILENAKIYYVHEALRICYTDGENRVSKANHSPQKVASIYESLLNETHYLETLKINLPDFFSKDCLRAIVFLVADHKKKNAIYYYTKLKSLKGSLI